MNTGLKLVDTRRQRLKKSSNPQKTLHGMVTVIYRRTRTKTMPIPPITASSIEKALNDAVVKWMNGCVVGFGSEAATVAVNSTTVMTQKQKKAPHYTSGGLFIF